MAVILEEDKDPLSSNGSFMSNHVLIFSDHKGNERFFLRRRATTADVQRWLERCAVWVGAGTAWASLKWEAVL